MGFYCNNIKGTNVRGVPYFTADTPQVRDTSVDFGLGFGNISPVGLVTINIASAIPEGTTGTLPVRFTLNNQTRELVFFGGTAVTAADLSGTGEILVFHNAYSGRLQLISALPTAAAAATGTNQGQGGN